MEFEICQVDPFSPSSYCFDCRKLFKPGQKFTTKRVEIPCRYDRQRRQLKGDKHLVFKIHVECQLCQ